MNNYGQRGEGGEAKTTNNKKNKILNTPLLLSSFNFAEPTKTPEPGNAKVISVVNQKGGVGKTTTTVNIAANLADDGYSK